jgi:hypothetical protein
MDCKRCDELLAAFKHSVLRFTNAVLNIPGALVDDPTLAVELVELTDDLRLKCTDASDALKAHLRQQHSHLPPKNHDPH